MSLGQADQKRRRQGNAAQRCVLDHDGDAGGFRDAREMLRHPLLIRSQPCPVIGGHQHQHAGARFGCLAGTLRGDARAEVTGGDDHRHAVAHMGEAHLRQPVPLLVRQEKLLGVICQDANSVDALIDHAIQHAALAFEIEVAGRCERRGSDREDAGQRGGGAGHGNSSWVGLVLAGQAIPWQRGRSAPSRDSSGL